MIFDLSFETVNRVNLEKEAEIYTSNPQDLAEFTAPAGQQHFKLLHHVSSQFKDAIIIDVGTHRGFNALALALGSPTSTVFTFDPVDEMSDSIRTERWQGQRVQPFHQSLMKNLDKFKNLLLLSSLIVLDMIPHSGSDELQLVQLLQDNNYRGLILADDIWYFKPMRDKFWYQIPTTNKVDCTHVGHWSGSGLIYFPNNTNNNQPPLFPSLEGQVSVPGPWPRRDKPPEEAKDQSWTFVTAYFDLTAQPDASPEIKARPLEHYMKNANMTMGLDVNLVVFCDKQSESILRALRPEHLLSKTRFQVVEFADLQIVQDFYQRIVDSRAKRTHNPDPRNTASYYLFCMSRYCNLLQTMKENPFDSTHFAWCNICIERMSWKSGIYFPTIFSEFRQKFSTCYIDFQPRNFVYNYEEFFKFGYCSMCSGFFTGNQYFMTQFCNRILEQFEVLLKMGLSHSDEQCYSYVFFKYPELFDTYLGDYTEMIVNYGWPTIRPEEPVRNFLSNLHKSGENWPLLKVNCEKWLVTNAMSPLRPNVVGFLLDATREMDKSSKK